jgi:DNA-binding PadR family transcriptional regulator
VVGALDASMYELLVLSLLMHWPLHAYRIAKIANDIVGPEERISTGTLSTLIGKLTQAGLIIPVHATMTPFPSDRASQVLAITAAGRERFLELMLDTSSHPGTYRRLFHVKALHLELLPPESQLFLVEHYLAHCRQLLRTKATDARDLASDPIKQEHMAPGFREAARRLVKLKTQQWELELAWAQSLREVVVVRLKQREERVPN